MITNESPSMCIECTKSMDLGLVPVKVRARVIIKRFTPCRAYADIRRVSSIDVKRNRCALRSTGKERK
jgi:hypothetical protein